jgi:hypothetical protein
MVYARSIAAVVRTAPTRLIDFAWTGILGGKHHANVELAGLGALAASRQEM